MQVHSVSGPPAVVLHRPLYKPPTPRSGDVPQLLGAGTRPGHWTLGWAWRVSHCRRRVVLGSQRIQVKPMFFHLPWPWV